MARHSRARVLACSLALASGACSGRVVSDGDPFEETGGGAGKKSGKGGRTGQGGSAGTSGDGGTSGSAGTGTGGSSGDPAVAGVLPVTRSARLTHAQYAAAMLELFGIADSPSETFAPDASNGFEFDNRLDLRVDARLGPQYRTAAETVAARVVSDTALFERQVTCDTAGAGCSDEFISSFGRRAVRRPLTADETTRFGALFGQGVTLVASGDAFRDGVRLVVEYVLQSPKFLYRNELGTETDAEGLIGLDDWEVASRLAFFLWNSIPDAALLDAAERGELGSEDAVRAAVSGDRKSTRLNSS